MKRLVTIGILIIGLIIATVITAQQFPEELLMTIKPPAAGGGTPPSSLVTNLISYWRMDEESGVRLDSVSTNHLQDSNTVGFTTGLITNASLYVSNSLEFLQIADNDAISVNNTAWSFSAWVKFYTTNVQHEIISKYVAADPSREWSLVRTDQGNIQFIYVTNGLAAGVITLASPNSGNGRPTTNVWTFLCAIVDDSAGQMRLWINTNAYTNTISVIFDAAGTAPLRFGFGNRVGRYFDGEIDDCGFWKRVLTVAEISNLYTNRIGYPFQ